MTICFAYLGLILINHFILVGAFCMCVILEGQAVQRRKSKVTAVNHIQAETDLIKPALNCPQTGATAPAQEQTWVTYLSNKKNQQPFLTRQVLPLLHKVLWEALQSSGKNPAVIREVGLWVCYISSCMVQKCPVQMDLHTQKKNLQIILYKIHYLRSVTQLIYSPAGWSDESPYLSCRV